MKIYKEKFLLATGPTGGHIFPLISLAQSLKKKGHEVHFVSTGSAIEKESLPPDFPVHFLRVGRIRKGVSFFERFKTLVLMPLYFIRSFIIIIKIKPHCVVGAGGSLSGPILLIASLMRKKTVIWELNAVPGLANKILSYFVHYVFICFSSAQKFFNKKKCIKVSFPVREDLIQKGFQKREADGYSHLLILGGSQGSHTINQVVMEMYQREDWSTWKIFHQTGKKDFNTIKNLYCEKDQCSTFIKDVGDYYQWADIVISRGGASTLSELAACGKAAIIIPLPSASDQHQYKNALEFKGAVEIILEKDLTSSLLFEKVMSIHSRKKRELETNIKKFYDPNHLEKTTQLLLKFI